VNFMISPSKSLERFWNERGYRIEYVQYDSEAELETAEYASCLAGTLYKYFVRESRF